MKPTTFCLIISASIAVLVFAILAQNPKQKKDGFVANLIEENWEMSMGVGITIGIVLVLILVFFIYLWNQPKKYNAANVFIPSYRNQYMNLN
jgi:preprotein translocase subunit YajC